MRSKVTVNHKRMRAYNAIDVCTSRSNRAHQSIWHALITTLFLSQKKREIFCRIFGNCTRRSIKSLAIFPRNIWQLQQLRSPRVDRSDGWDITYMQLQQRKVNCECSSSFKQPASHEYIPFHTIHSCIHSLIHSFNRGHRHLTADQPPGLLGKHEFIGYY